MKKILNLLLQVTIFFNLSDSFSQWTGNPNNPLAICNEPFDQTSAELIRDGNNGYFVFWNDRRNFGGVGPCDIYGQKLNGTGYNLWAASGTKIVDSVPGL